MGSMIIRSRPALAIGNNTHGRTVHTSSQKLSKMFFPSGNVTLRSTDKGGGQGHELLLKAGYIRQSSSGIFSLLPLGQLVMTKIETRIDHYMSLLDANKILLPTLAPRKLWEDTGRWRTSGQELFKLRDRKDADFCLAPTHEEAVTKLVGAEVNGYRQLPVRVYQIGRKFRDEMRPRGGMLRAKEFIMKDLYTFDDGLEKARTTYKEVSDAYMGFFGSLGVSFLVAEADSGNIGGDLSHEYHLPSTTGEDTLLKCSSCEYVANQELAKTKNVDRDGEMEVLRFCHQIYRDSVFFEVEVPAGRDLNMLQLTREAQKLDASVTLLTSLGVRDPSIRNSNTTVYRITSPSVLKVIGSDACPNPECHGSLEEVQAIEIGHTFHLGQKYSSALNFKYSNAANQSVSPEMGCHGIGVSRLLSALAEIGHDEYGLRWPTGLEPFHTALVVEPEYERIAEVISDHLGPGTVIDDRKGKSAAYKIKDMEVIGVPRIIVLGKRFSGFGQNKNFIAGQIDLSQVTVELGRRGCSQKEFDQIRIADL